MTKISFLNDIAICILIFGFHQMSIIYPSNNFLNWGFVFSLCLGILIGRLHSKYITMSKIESEVREEMKNER